MIPCTYSLVIPVRFQKNLGCFGIYVSVIIQFGDII